MNNTKVGTVVWATRDKDGYVHEWTAWENPEQQAHEYIQNRVCMGLARPGEEAVLMRVLPPWTEVTR